MKSRKQEANVFICQSRIKGKMLRHGRVHVCVSRRSVCRVERRKLRGVAGRKKSTGENGGVRGKATNTYGGGKRKDGKEEEKHRRRRMAREKAKEGEKVGKKQLVKA